jgi:hypothetical protein
MFLLFNEHILDIIQSHDKKNYHSPREIISDYEIA